MSSTLSSMKETSKGTYKDYLTIIAAYFGINTIKGISGHRNEKLNKDGLDDVDYYTTTNRKAFSISDTVEVRSDYKYLDEPTTKKDVYKYSLRDRSTWNSDY